MAVRWLSDEEESPLAWTSNCVTHRPLPDCSANQLLWPACSSRQPAPSSSCWTAGKSKCPSSQTADHLQAWPHWTSLRTPSGQGWFSAPSLASLHIEKLELTSVVEAYSQCDKEDQTALDWFGQYTTATRDTFLDVTLTAPHFCTTLLHHIFAPHFYTCTISVKCKSMV